jgi:type III restriction enzyme
MAQKIAFQFDDKLQYQLDAVNSVIRLFEGLPQKVSGMYQPITRIEHIAYGDPVRNAEISGDTRLLDNLRKVQLENSLYPDKIVFPGNNFTVEMETGTGKTYVYLRTILELYKEYGFRKFMIVVPSIAIRMGVEKSIDMLIDHFKKIYGIDPAKHSFIYESNNLTKIRSNFIEANDLAVCILNIQAFNKDTNKIRIEDEHGHTLWEDIKYLRPIIIIDEPQKIEGGKKNRSKSLQAIEGLNPLFILRYSATHKNLYNQVYRLNSYDAYKRGLVKHIEIKTVNGVIPKDFAYIRYLEFTRDLKARIEIFSQKQGNGIKFEIFDVRGGASLYDLSSGLPQYADWRVAVDPYKGKPLQIDAGGSAKEIYIGRGTYQITDNEAIRIQIRLAIENHYKKQAMILNKGYKIKALTLFFVDSVSKVRDNNAEDGRGEYLRIFDEEYEQYISSQEYKRMFQTHNQQMPFLTMPEQSAQVRESYFAVDKNKNAVEIEDWDSSVADEEAKVKTKSQEDIDRGIELILRRKDELISFDEPLAFIFSHSALREGWDNPNVFIICNLKNGGSEIAKKQEIGRGLRLAVDINGVRCIDSSINQLTVIANDNFAHFADSLQKDFNDSMNFKKDEATPELLLAVLKSAGIPVNMITPELVDKLREELYLARVIDIKNMLTRNADKIVDSVVFSDQTLKEHALKIMECFITLMAEKGISKIDIRNGDNDSAENGLHPFVTEDKFFKTFRCLAKNLSKRTIYRLNFDSDRFISECVTEINDILATRKVNAVYEITTADLLAKEKGQIDAGDASTKTLDSNAKNNIVQKNDLELASIVMCRTNLPRLAILRILAGIKKKILLSHQDILDLVVKFIRQKLSDAKAEAVSCYEVVNGYEFDDKMLFAPDSIDEHLLREEKKVYQTKESERRALNKFYRVDSDNEYDFAMRLDGDPDVLLFTKIKRNGFVIDTPYGSYSPDWAIVYKNNNASSNRLFVIVETNFRKEWKDLTNAEKLKIKCGVLHFKAVAATTSDSIRFEWVNSYQSFKISLDKSI